MKISPFTFALLLACQGPESALDESAPPSTKAPPPPPPQLATLGAQRVKPRKTSRTRSGRSQANRRRMARRVGGYKWGRA